MILRYFDFCSGGHHHSIHTGTRFADDVADDGVGNQNFKVECIFWDINSL